MSKFVIAFVSWGTKDLLANHSVTAAAFELRFNRASAWFSLWCAGVMLLIHCSGSCQSINHYTIFGWTDKVLSSTLIIHHLVSLLSDGDHSPQEYVIMAYHTDMTWYCRMSPSRPSAGILLPIVVYMGTFEIMQILGIPHDAI